MTSSRYDSVAPVKVQHMTSMWHILIIAILTIGMSQSILITYTGIGTLKNLDDAGALLLILLAAWQALKNGCQKALILYGCLVLLCLVNLLRVSILTLGITQIKQVLFPAGFIFVGYVLRNSIDWVKLMRGQLVLSMIAAIWAIWEWVIGRPLIDPLLQYAFTGETPRTRDGFLFAYVYDMANGAIGIRSGGPFMNPPMTGFFLGGSVVCAVQLGVSTKRLRYWLIIPLLTFAIYVAYARAGMLILLAVTVTPIIWKMMGRAVALILSLIGAYIISGVFFQEGNTANHAQGLQSGLQSIVLSPWGVGFGSTGYQAVLAGTGTDTTGSESLFGLWLNWLGLPIAILLAVAMLSLLFLLVRTKSPNIFYLAALATLIAGGLSETASATSASMILWIMCGYSLADCWQKKQSYGSDVISNKLLPK